MWCGNVEGVIPPPPGSYTPSSLMGWVWHAVTSVCGNMRRMCDLTSHVDSLSCSAQRKRPNADFCVAFATVSSLKPSVSAHTCSSKSSSSSRAC
jgi:hypothetical protein